MRFIPSTEKQTSDDTPMVLIQHELSCFTQNDAVHAGSVTLSHSTLVSHFAGRIEINLDIFNHDKQIILSPQVCYKITQDTVGFLNLLTMSHCGV